MRCQEEEALMETVIVKTADLQGAALNWAVAMSTGTEVDLCPSPFTSEYWPVFHSTTRAFNPSANWAQGGPLIEEAGLAVAWTPDLDNDGNEIKAAIAGVCVGLDPGGELMFIGGAGYSRWHYGPTPLIAAMRALVAAKLGDEVQVPAALMEGDGDE